MPQAAFTDLLQFLYKVSAARHAKDLSDAELLKRFVEDRDEAAFSALVRRHGPMVLGVCRRAMGDAHLAEDAFQATFMVLAQRAGSVRKKGFVAGWLHGVAQRIALKARARNKAARHRERRSIDMPQSEPLDELTGEEVRAVLDKEIGRLPEKYRTPIVLCHLEGRSYEQAARQLGWSKSTLAKRLARARDLLRRQLVQRGITLSASALATVLTEKAAPAAVAAMLAVNTVKAAMSAAAGKAVAGSAISAQAIILAEEGMKATIGMSGKVVVLMLTLGLAVGGAGLAGHGAWGGGDTADQEATKSPRLADTSVAHAWQKTAMSKDQKKDGLSLDLYGEPLPEGAIARLGTMKFRHGFGTRSIISPNGAIIASGEGDLGFGLCFWDTATGRLERRVSEPRYLRPMGFSSDSKAVIANAGADLVLIDVATGQAQRRFTSVPTHNLGAATLSKDGQVAAACQLFVPNPKIIIWDVATANVLHRLDGHREEIRDVAISPDSKMLASASDDAKVRLWDLATGKVLRLLEGHEKEVCSVAFSPSGKEVVSASKDGVIRLWDAVSGQPLRMINSKNGAISVVVYSPDGKSLASGGEDGTIRMWSSESGELMRNWPATASSEIRSLTFSLDGKMLVSTARSECVTRLWNSTTGKELSPIESHAGPVGYVRFSADGKKIFSVASWQAQAIEWNLAAPKDGRRLYEGPLGRSSGAPWCPIACAPSPDGKILALMGGAWVESEYKADPVIHLWDTSVQKETGSLKGHDRSVFRSSFSPDGEHLVSVDSVGFRLWNLSAGKELHHFKGETNPIAYEFSRDGKTLAINYPSKHVVELWDISGTKSLRQFKTQDLVFAFAFSPDDKLLAMSSSEGNVSICETLTGKEVGRFQAAGLSEKIAFSPTGRVIAAGARDRKLTKTRNGCAIHLFDMHAGEEIRLLDVPQGAVWSLEFSPNGRTLASGGCDSTILLWDVGGYAQLDGINVGKLNETDLEVLWLDLAGDAPKADKTIWNLVAMPKTCLPMLKERMRCLKADAAEIAKLLTNLDSSSFAERQNAAQALEVLGESAEAAVRKLLEGKPSLEVRQRLQQFLDNRNKEVIRKLRAIEVLELIGTVEAGQILESLAKEAPNPRVSEGATGALARLNKRQL